jgi:hypothetical protein
MALADLADESGLVECPAVGDLARWAILSDRAVQRHLVELEAEDWIERVGRGGLYRADRPRWQIKGDILDIKGDENSIKGGFSAPITPVVSPLIAEIAPVMGDKNDVKGDTISPPKMSPIHLTLDLSSSSELRERSVQKKISNLTREIRRAGQSHYGLGFYWAYPRHKEKQEAVKAWVKLDPEPEQRAIIMTALKAQFPEVPTDLKFTPYPARWLRAGKWEDDIDKTPNSWANIPRLKPLEECANNADLPLLLARNIIAKRDAELAGN